MTLSSKYAKLFLVPVALMVLLLLVGGSNQSTRGS
jgi:hypothetical protein